MLLNVEKYLEITEDFNSNFPIRGIFPPFSPTGDATGYEAASNLHVQGFIQPADPQAWINDPSNQPQAPQSNILLRTWKMGEKMGKKSIFYLDFCM